MKLVKKAIIITVFLFSVSICGFTAEDLMKNMVSARAHIQNLDKTLEQVKKRSKVAVEFPAFIPKPQKIKKYFSSIDANSQQYGFEYMINIDSTPSCKGAKYCNVAIFSARQSEQIDKMKNKQDKIITTPVMLADGLHAYYTPGHAIGDYFPASIQWLDNKVLYMITWNGNLESAQAERAALITMANSAKHPGSK